MLNIRKIESAINGRSLTDADIARILNRPYNTIVNKRKKGNWSPNDVELFADFFGKSILYFFDREEENNQVSEPGTIYNTCKNCIEKQKEIERLRLRVDDISDRYIDLLESKNSETRDCG